MPFNQMPMNTKPLVAPVPMGGAPMAPKPPMGGAPMAPAPKPPMPPMSGGAPMPKPPMPAPPGNKVNKNRDMRSNLVPEDKELVKSLVSKGLALLHSDSKIAKLKSLLQKGIEPNIAISDILDDVLEELDTSQGPLALAVLTIVGVMLLSELAKLISQVTKKEPNSEVLKMALVKAIESIVGKEAGPKAGVPVAPKPPMGSAPGGGAMMNLLKR